VALFHLERHTEAQAALEEAAALEPFFLEHAFVAGVVAFRSGDYSAQIIQQERVLRLDPARATLLLHNQLGIAHAVAGNYLRATEVLEAGRKFDGDSALEDWRVVVAYAIGGWDRAVAVWQATHAAPKTYQDRKALLWLVYYGLLDLGDRARKARANYAALKHYTRAQAAIVDFHTRTNIGNDWANEQLKDLFARISETYRALPLKPALPESTIDSMRSAEAMLRAKKTPPSVAAKTYLAALAEAPWSPEVHYNLALTVASDRPHALPWAIQELERFVSLAPDDPHAPEAKQRIDIWKSTISKLAAVCGARVIVNPVDLDAPLLAMRTECDSPH
jgi:tetratricopeptide (TPR) repeat protein